MDQRLVEAAVGDVVDDGLAGVELLGVTFHRGGGMLCGFLNEHRFLCRMLFKDVARVACYRTSANSRRSASASIKYIAMNAPVKLTANGTAGCARTMVTS